MFPAHSEFGEPYCYAIPFRVQARKWWWWLRRRPRGYLELEGMTRAIGLCQARAIRQAVAAAGWGVVSTRRSGCRRGTREVARRHWRRS